MPTPAIMLQGTSSNAGKSLLVAGLARAFANRGLRVAPFKPQNMSNNAAVTSDGGEIGRAQALQARACRVPTSVHMNPVLLKPQSDTGSQVIVQGKVLGSVEAGAYHALKPQLLGAVLDSFATVSAAADLVVVEGAGSPAEINLRAGDIANMGFARAADVPVLLVGDIERGGVIASLVGTVALLDDADRALLRGTIVNKFRGDPRLFDPALPILEDRTGLPCLGVVPWFEPAAVLPKEDLLGLEELAAGQPSSGIRICVPHLPRLSNLDDLDPLARDPAVRLDIVEPGRALPGDAALVLLPGSKSTLADLRFLRAQGWDVDIAAHVRRGGWVLGLCGGFQMLGTSIADPQGLEGPPGAAAGLGLLEVETVLGAQKILRQAHGVDHRFGRSVSGYEIHLGRTDGPACARPLLDLAGRPDGAVSRDGRILGCYLHGLLAADAFRNSLLAALGAPMSAEHHHDDAVEQALDGLADHLAARLDLDRILAIAARGAASTASREPGHDADTTG